MGKLAITGGDKTFAGGGYTKWPVFDQSEKDALAAVLKQKAQGKNGAAAARFEKRFAAYNGTKHCILCANGTVSIELILRGLGIGRGDEVIVPPYTFIATVSSIIFAGATPVFADIEPDTYILSAESVKKKITSRTKAVMPVYVGGRPADLDAFIKLAADTGLYLIGDAAQAAGSEWRGKSIGSYGIAASFSCQNSKNLTCGEGGIITTNSDALAGNIRAMLSGGKGADGKYTHIGVNHNISEWQAAILDSQMNRLDGQIARRMENAAYLDGLLAQIPCVAPLKADKRITKDSYHLYFIRILEDKLNGVSRDRFIQAVQAEGFDLCAGYMPVYGFSCLSSGYAVNTIGGKINLSPGTATADRIAGHEASWLYHSLLLNDKPVIKAIAGAFKKVYENLNELKREGV